MTLKNRRFRLGIFIVISSTMLIISCGSNNGSSNDVQTNTQQEFLPVEKAFVFSTNAEDKQKLQVSWVIADGYHLYKDKFKFSVSPESVKIVEVKYPKAEIFSDKNLGKLESYSGSIEINIEISEELTSEKISLTSVYQGCADVGLCYPPETKITDFDLASL